MTQVIVCCGAGGTGKTTTAAAIGVKLAIQGQRVAVLTIDPAKRLADALGLGSLDNDPKSVSLTELNARGTLHALMLDRKATFDAMVIAHSPNPDVAERLLANAYYQAVSTRLTGLHEYMATEKLQQLVESGLWDVVVLDTPPTQHAIDFFHAPERVGRLFEHGVLATLMTPARGLVGVATRRAVGLLERLAGESVLHDIAEFFRLISGLSEIIRSRNMQVHALLRSDRTRFYQVTAPALDACEEVEGFASLLREQGMRLEGLLVNRVTPVPQFTAPLVRERLPEAPLGVPDEEWDTMANALLALIPRAEARAQQHERAIVALKRSAHTEVWKLPELPAGVRTIDTLAGLGPHLPPLL